MEKIVFTNGCFDILHSGHIKLLETAKTLGTKLIVGINSDDSVRSIKGEHRPVIDQNERAAILIGLSAVDEVKIFDEATPERLIREIEPNVLVKGGDWDESQIVGADFVKASGGEVVSIPLKEGISSSDIIDRIRTEKPDDAGTTPLDGDLVGRAISEHEELVRAVSSEGLTERIRAAGEIICECLSKGNKVLLCGNGGSAADAQHIAAELIGRYVEDRRAFPAIALTTDTSALTAISNDFTFENVFARQVEGLAKEGDCLIGISTSGNSENIFRAIMAARKKDCSVIGLTSTSGTKMAALCDRAVMVSSETTSRIQEIHILIGHIWCEMVDARFLGSLT